MAIINGTPGDNILDDTPGDDVINAGDGDDIINITGGEDVIDGGDGFDIIRLTDTGNFSRIFFSSLNQPANGTFRSGAGEDEITFQNIEQIEIYLPGQTTPSAVFIIGPNGNDIIDTSLLPLNSSSDRVTISTGDGDDIITSNPNVRTQVFAGDGDDIVYGGSGQSGIWPGLGNDTIFGAPGESNGLSFSDLLSNEAIFIDMNAGTARTNSGSINTTFTDIFYLYAGDGDDYIIGRDGGRSDALYGEDGDDIILGLAGDDNLNGQDGNDTIIGGEGNDRLDGNDGNDFLFGGEGNDRIDTGRGSDTAYGGSGDDTIEVRGSGSFVDGGEGADELDLNVAYIGVIDLSVSDVQTDENGFEIQFLNIENFSVGSSNARITVFGTDGNNQFDGRSGNDTFIGRGGDDDINGSSGIDTASYITATSAVLLNLSLTTAQADGQGGADTLRNIENLTGSDFNDRLEGDEVANRLEGGLGDDFLIGRAGNDVLLGGAGDNTLFGGSGSDTASYEGLTAGVTIDLNLVDIAQTVIGGSDSLRSIENLRGSNFDDDLTGDAGDNMFNGLRGDDDINGGAGNDRINGSVGNDDLFGGTGSDILNGGTGDDIIDGWSGFDTASYTGLSQRVVVNLNVSTAQDTLGGGIDTILRIENLIGTGQDDILTGNSNQNRLEGSNGDDLLDGQSGGDTLLGGNGNDTLLGGSGGDRLFGGAGNDDLDGGSQRDRLEGGDGNDTLNGGADVDRLFGGDGNDILIGGTGTDFLYGGAGADTFRFLSANDTGVGAYQRDELRDFATLEDVIDVSAIDADTTTAGNQAFIDVFASFTGQAGQIALTNFSNGRTLVEFDTDGDAIADFQILVNANGLDDDSFIFGDNQASSNSSAKASAPSYDSFWEEPDFAEAWETVWAEDAVFDIA